MRVPNPSFDRLRQVERLVLDEEDDRGTGDTEDEDSYRCAHAVKNESLLSFINRL